MFSVLICVFCELSVIILCVCVTGACVLVFSVFQCVTDVSCVFSVLNLCDYGINKL